jgi:uncharacterized protein
MSNAAQSPYPLSRTQALGIGVFALVAVVGLYLVKWNPYFHRVFVAAAHHSIGNSIVSGTSPVPPPPSWQAAWNYTLAYGRAIWQAMVVGLLLGSGVQALVPRSWIQRVLGRVGFGSVAAAGLAAVPSMM